MTKQPNERAAALRMALDMLDKLDADLRAREAAKPDESDIDIGFRRGLLFARLLVGDVVVDGLQDQLLDAGGFLGDEPEPPEERAFILDRNGAVLAFYYLDGLDPDEYAELYADAAGLEIDQDGLVPDGCEDFSVKIAETPDAVRCWTSRNYMIKAEA